MAACKSSEAPSSTGTQACRRQACSFSTRSAALRLFILLGARGVIAPLADAAIKDRIADGLHLEYTAGESACNLDVVTPHMYVETAPPTTFWAAAGHKLLQDQGAPLHCGALHWRK